MSFLSLQSAMQCTAVPAWCVHALTLAFKSHFTAVGIVDWEGMWVSGLRYCLSVDCEWKRCIVWWFLFLWLANILLYFPSFTASSWWANGTHACTQKVISLLSFVLLFFFIPQSSFTPWTLLFWWWLLSLFNQWISWQLSSFYPLQK